MTFAAKDATGATVQIAQPVTGPGLKAAGTLVTLPTDSDHARTGDIAALQSALITAIGLLATDQDVMAGNAKLEAIRLLLATPVIPGGAATSAKQDAAAAIFNNILTVLGPQATDVSVQAVTTKLEAVRALLAAPVLASGAASDTSVQAITSKLEAIRLLQASPALPTGGATEATLQAIKAAILAQVDLANLIVTDGSGYYVRRETVNEGTGAVTVSFVTLAGAPASPNTAALTPVTASGSGGAASTRVVETALFDVVTAGTGTTVGDVVARVLVYDTAANSVVASYWHNLTTGAALASAPAAGAIVAQPRNLAVGAAKDATLVTIDDHLNAGLGTDGTSPPSLPGGATGVRGWLRLLVSLLPASLGAKLSAASLSIAPALDALFKTAQPDVATTGTIAAATANASFVVPLANGEGVVGFALSGLTASGAVLTAEASNDGGTTYQPINLVSKVLGDGSFSTTANLDGNYRVNSGGHSNVRLRVTTAGTGTIGVAALASSQNPLVALSGPVAQTADQDPIFDHTNGKKVSITTSALVFTPAAGCKYARISCDADVVVNTAGAAAVDDGTSIRIVANAPEVIPVVPGTAVYALSLSGSAAVVRATPMKVRS